MWGDVNYISREVKDEMDWPSTGGSKTRSESGDGGTPSTRFGKVSDKSRGAAGLKM